MLALPPAPIWRIYTLGRGMLPQPLRLLPAMHSAEGSIRSAVITTRQILFNSCRAAAAERYGVIRISSVRAILAGTLADGLRRLNLRFAEGAKTAPRACRPVRPAFEPEVVDDAEQASRAPGAGHRTNAWRKGSIPTRTR